MTRALLVLLLACGGGPAKTPGAVTAAPPASVAKAAVPGELAGVVRKLRVEGAHRAQVEAELAPAMGKPVISDELRAALGRVMRIPGVADVTVQGVQLADGVELVVEVTAQPVMRKLVAIEAGGKPIPLGIGAITPNAPLDPHRVQTLAQTLRDRYITNGYFDAAVTWTHAKVGDGVEVTIEVVPGPASSIDAVTFVGTSVPKKHLDAAVAKFLVVGEPLVVDRIESAAQALSAYYWDHGYANVNVRAPQAVAGKVTLAFEIAEGPQFKIGKIDITGLPPSERPKYLAMFGVKQGDLFNRTAIVAGRKRIIDALVATGKPAADVLPVTKIDVPTKRIGLTLEVTGL